MDFPYPIMLFVVLAWVLVIVQLGVRVYKERCFIQSWLTAQSYIASSVKWRLPWNSPFDDDWLTRCMIYRAEVTDQNQRHFAVWVRIRLSLFGAIKDTEIKFENANAY
jgi:hypothetical protein